MSAEGSHLPEGVAAETVVVRGPAPDPVTGAVIPPIHLSTTFARDADNALLNPDHAYVRDQNPSFAPAETALARIEEGTDALLFASGMSAAMTVIQALEPGDEVLIPSHMYWSLRGWLNTFCATWGLTLTRLPLDDPGRYPQLIKDTLASAGRAKTRLVWLETPANPTWQVVDIAACCDAAHAAGARVAVDSTAATPVLTRPLTLGADLVMHSATKYLNGHSDVAAGALVTRQADSLWKRIRRIRAEQGAIPGGFEAWLLARGMRTLYLRVPRACENALAIARRFENDPRLSAVLYPGLASHPGHAVAARQMQGGFGGMLSLRVRGGRDAALAAIGRCGLFARATSLGGVESLVEHRHSIEGPDSPIPDDMLRLSIGIEHVDDLIRDLDQALG